MLGTKDTFAILAILIEASTKNTKPIPQKNQPALGIINKSEQTK